LKEGLGLFGLVEFFAEGLGAQGILPKFGFGGFGLEFVDAFYFLVEVKVASGRWRVFLGGLGCGISALWP